MHRRGREERSPFPGPASACASEAGGALSRTRTRPQATLGTAKPLLGRLDKGWSGRRQGVRRQGAGLDKGSRAPSAELDKGYGAELDKGFLRHDRRLDKGSAVLLPYLDKGSTRTRCVTPGERRRRRLGCPHRPSGGPAPDPVGRNWIMSRTGAVRTAQTAHRTGARTWCGADAGHQPHRGAPVRCAAHEDHRRVVRRPIRRTTHRPRLSRRGAVERAVARSRTAPPAAMRCGGFLRRARFTRRQSTAPTGTPIRCIGLRLRAAQRPGRPSRTAVMQAGAGRA